MKNINAIKSRLSKSFITILLVFVGLMFIFWLIIFAEYHTTQKALLKEKLESAIIAYKTNLSEKLSIIASSIIFEQYLKSGRNSRSDLYIQFLNEILTLKDNSIIGMEIKYVPSPLMKGIESSQPELIFQYGNIRSPYHVDLWLCYLNNRLDSENGICRNTWKIYFSKSKLISYLKRINQDIEECSDGRCNQVDAIGSDSFGSFPVVSASSLPVSLKIENHTDMRLYLISVMTILLMVSLAFFIRRKTKNIINTAFADPLNKTIAALRKGELPKTYGYIEELEYLCDQILDYYKEKDKIEIAKIAGQAAHDIRSPLVALEIAIKNLYCLPEQQRILIRNATTQIRDIANNLLQQNVSREAINYAEIKDVILIPIIEYVISEKNVELPERNPKIQLKCNISESSYETFIKVVPLELKRILSNLFNNAIEAIGDNRSGVINISVQCKEDKAIIKINDDGPGIPKSIINQVFNEGVTSKEKGSGLGLYHAKTNIEKWGGNIELISEYNNGAKIIITMPKQPTASWFAKRLSLPFDSTVIVIDDSKSVHDLWRQRFSKNEYSDITFKYFDTMSTFMDWYKNANKDESGKLICLVDYEFSGEKLNGLDIINELPPSSQKILVTSRAEDFDIQDRCLKLGIQLIPKYYISFIPFIRLNNNVDFILIEEDESLIDAWKFRARKRNEIMICYNDLNNFYLDYRLFGKKTKIFLSDVFVGSIAKIKHFSFDDITIITHIPSKYRHLTDIKIAEKHTQ